MKNKKTIDLLLGMLNKNSDEAGAHGSLSSLNDSLLFRLRGGYVDQNTGCDNTGDCTNASCNNKNCKNDTGSNTSCTNTGCTNSGCVW